MDEGRVGITGDEKPPSTESGVMSLDVLGSDRCSAFDSVVGEAEAEAESLGVDGAFWVVVDLEEEVLKTPDGGFCAVSVLCLSLY